MKTVDFTYQIKLLILHIKITVDFTYQIKLLILHIK